MNPKSTNPNLPLVTFISPCYNHSKYVVQSLNSIRLQTYPHIKHIIIDDCSTDDSVAVIENWIKTHNYNCLFIKHPVNKGISYTLNEAIDLAEGIYCTPLSTDDYIVPERTETFVRFLENNQAVPMVVSDAKIVDDNNVPIKKELEHSFINYCLGPSNTFDKKNGWLTYETLLQQNFVPGSLMFRNSVFKELGKFDTSMKVEDWNMWLRIARKYKIGYINEQLTYYRMHAENTMNNAQLRQQINNDLLETLLIEKDFCYQSAYKTIFQNTVRKFLDKNYTPSLLLKMYPLFAKYQMKGAFAKELIYRLNKKINPSSFTGSAA